jgi:hypothetical protein
MKDKGLIAKYIIHKLDGSPVDENAEYFVLRLDYKGKDKKHIDACRKAVLTYANEVKEHLPLLAKELIEKYEN